MYRRFRRGQVGGWLASGQLLCCGLLGLFHFSAHFLKLKPTFSINESNVRMLIAGKTHLAISGGLKIQRNPLVSGGGFNIHRTPFTIRRVSL